MNAVILNGAARTDDRACSVAHVVHAKLGGGSGSRFDLAEMDIRPCLSCGSCGLRTPGVCVIKDDLPLLLRAMAHSPLLVFITPVRFGGYSSQLKKAIDRLMTMGLPLYLVRDGHLLHPTRYVNPRRLLGVGLLDSMTQERETLWSSTFDLHIRSNALNMLMERHKTLLIPGGLSEMEIPSAVHRAIEEVQA